MLDSNYHINFLGFGNPDKDRAHLKDVGGRYRTNLFCDFNTTRHEKYPPLYTMREAPHKGLPSAYQIYMYSDSEYDAAMKLVGSWAHWQRLLACPAFMKGPEDAFSWTGLEDWRTEKELRDQANAYMQLKEAAESGNVQAQRLIYEGKGTASKRGRPSKAEIKAAAEEAAQHAKDIKSDVKKLKLVINGDKAGSN